MDSRRSHSRIRDPYTHTARCDARAASNPLRPNALLALPLPGLALLLGHDLLDVGRGEAPHVRGLLVIHRHVVLAEQHLIEPLPAAVVSAPGRLARRARAECLDGPPLQPREHSKASLQAPGPAALGARCRVRALLL